MAGNPERETLKNLLLTAAAVCLLGLLTADCVAALSPQSGYSIHWVTEKTDASTTLVEVSGINPSILDVLRHVTWSPAEWQRVLAVHAQPGDSLAGKGLPAMLGAYSVSSNRLRFEPQFPLAHQGRVPSPPFNPEPCPARAPGQEALTSTHRAEAQNAGPPTVVTHIYPSASVLPENLLKFYLQFSGPMNRGDIYDHIHLHDAKGKTVELPFLEIDEELWSPDMTRLTLFMTRAGSSAGCSRSKRSARRWKRKGWRLSSTPTGRTREENHSRPGLKSASASDPPIATLPIPPNGKSMPGFRQTPAADREISRNPRLCPGSAGDSRGR